MEDIAMDINFYREFLTLAETRNFWEASARLFISESTLSKHISRMETELEIKLFDRTSRRMELTRYGKMLIPYAEQIVKTELESANAILSAREEEGGVLMLGILPDASHCRMTDIIVRFKDSYPDAMVKATEDDTLPLKEALRDHRIELAFLRESQTEPIAEPDLVKIPFLEDRMVVLLRKNHPLAEQLALSLADLKNEKFILNKRQTYMNTLQLMACRNAGFVPHTAFACNRMDTLKDLVEQGLGIGLIMSSQISLSAEDDLAAVTVTPSYRSTIYLAKRSKGKISENAGRFLECMLELKEEMGE